MAADTGIVGVREGGDTCVACAGELSPGARFCSACGVGQTAECPSCRETVSPTARFCSSCGSPLRRGDERLDDGELKLVSVVFCDIVGSTGLTERIGAEAMHELLDRFVAIAASEIERLGGRLAKVIGDAVMAVVGVPAAREDHAERALLIASGLRTAVGGMPVPEHERPLEVRTGVNSGEVVVAAIGGERPLEQATVGDTINVAARLQARAAPSEILVGESTARLLRDPSGLEPAGTLALQGRDAPVRVHRLVSPVRSSRKRALAPPAGPFVGRDRPLRLLRDLVDQASAGEGQVASIVAEAGMGKSRLLGELRRRLDGTGVRWLEGRCRSYGQAIPYLPLLDVLRQRAGIGKADTPATVLVCLRAALAFATPEPDGPANLLGDLLASVDENRAEVGLSSEAVRRRTFEAFRHVLLAPSGGPTVLAVEDVQWIDPSSRDVLVDLAERLDESPMLLVTTQRPGARLDWMNLAHASQIPLTRLGTDDAFAVVKAAASSDIRPDAMASLLARAEGNPMFLEQLARHLAGADDAGKTIPESVQGVLSARIDRLRPDTRRVLYASAVLGRLVEADLLRSLLPGQPDLDEALAELVREGFLIERRQGGLTFRHALIQEVAYGGLLASRRRSLHRATAEALEASAGQRTHEALDRLAHHLARAGQGARALDYLRPLGRRAAARHAHTEAARTFERALTLLTDLPGRDADVVDLTLALVSSRYFLGELEVCRRLLLEQEDRLRRANRPTLVARHRFWLAHILSHLGDTEGADREARRAVEEAEVLGDASTVGRAEYVLARESVWRGRYVAGLEHGGRAVEQLGDAREPWWLAHAHCWLAANHAFLSDFGAAFENTARAQQIGESLGDARVVSYATGQSGWFEALRGDGPRAIALAETALAGATDPLGRALATAVLGLGCREAGDATAAVAALDRAIVAMDSFGYSRLVCWYTAWRADARMALDDHAGAAADAEKAVTLSRLLGSPWSEGLALRTLGCLDLMLGRETGHKLLKEALAIFEKLGAHTDSARTRAALARANSAPSIRS